MPRRQPGSSLLSDSNLNLVLINLFVSCSCTARGASQPQETRTAPPLSPFLLASSGHRLALLRSCRLALLCITVAWRQQSIMHAPT